MAEEVSLVDTIDGLISKVSNLRNDVKEFAGVKKCDGWDTSAEECKFPKIPKEDWSLYFLKDVDLYDVRFPTSKEKHGSDAIHKDPDYSAAYIVLEFATDKKPSIYGHGMSFTLGRGNDVLLKMIDQYVTTVKFRSLQSILENIAGFTRELMDDSQLRWFGPEKGMAQLAVAAIMNAMWDLWAKLEGKPLWKLIVDMEATDLVHKCMDMKYLSEVLTKEEAISMLEENKKTAGDRENELIKNGFPVYTTSAGWVGYTDERIKSLCKEYLDLGYNHFKMKVGVKVEDDIRRAGIIREMIGPDRKLMMDANQVWEVEEAIEWMKKLAEFKPWWIEEPTHCDDIMGHLRISEALGEYDIGVATGEVCSNKVMFKQLIKMKAIKFCQIDSCRMASISEILPVLILAKKFDIAVCPHAGGVGLCEMVRHLVMVDYILIGVNMDDRICESTTHLHEHFYDNCMPQKNELGARYMPPKRAGYIEMKPESINDYLYPSGPKCG